MLILCAIYLRWYTDFALALVLATCQAMKAQLTEARDEKERVEKERERLERELNDVKQENRGEYELMLRHKDERIAALEGAFRQEA